MSFGGVPMLERQAAAAGPASSARALIGEIERKVEAECREVLAAAAREASEARERSRVKARRQLRRTLAEMRAVANSRRRELHAELEAAQRQSAIRRATSALTAAWPQLESELQRLWHDPPARARWITSQLELARMHLPPTGWTLSHPAALAAEELAAFGAACHPSHELHAGLVIETQGARLSSTPAALLADRAAVESALLAALELQDTAR